MRVQTRNFGVVETTQDQVVRMIGPMLGFEHLRRFAVLPAPDAPPFHILQSLEDPSVAFPLVSAGNLGVHYPDTSEFLGRVGARGPEEVECWVVAALASGEAPMRVNLRAPVVINRAAHVAAQVIVREEQCVAQAAQAARSAAPCMVAS